MTSIPLVKTTCMGIQQVTVQFSAIGFESPARLKYSESINLICRLSSSNYRVYVRLRPYKSCGYLFGVMENQLNKHLLRAHLSYCPVGDFFVDVIAARSGRYTDFQHQIVNNFSIISRYLNLVSKFNLCNAPKRNLSKQCNQRRRVCKYCFCLILRFFLTLC